MENLDLNSDKNIFRCLDSKNPKKPRSFLRQDKSPDSNFYPTSESFGFDYFDRPNSQSGYDGYKYDGRWVPVAAKIIELYNPQSVLDYGCAKGYLVYDLFNQGITRAFGTDISEYALNLAPAQIRHNLVRSDGNPLPFSDKSIDLCVSRGVLEHIPENYLDIIISDIMRISKTQFLDVTGGNSQKTRDYAIASDVTHVTIRPESWWIEKLSRLGYGGVFLFNEPQLIEG